MKTFTLKASALAIALGATLIPQQAYACGTDPYLGGICVFAGNFAPRGYAFAEGQLLSISANSALFSILGTTYGGDGRITFALPDLRGRVAIGYGNGPGLSNYNLGAKGGAETVTLTVTQMPNHNHTASTTVNPQIDNSAINAGSTISLHGVAATANSNNPNGNTLAMHNRRRSGFYTNNAPDVGLANEAIAVNVTIDQTTDNSSTTISNSGASQAHENRMPYIAMHWIIAVQGLFPSRS